MYSKSLLFATSFLTLHLLSTSASALPQDSSSSCLGVQVLNACVASTTAITRSCGASDYNCLCQKWADVVTCYNECPTDPNVATPQSYKSSYCSAAAAYPSPSSSIVIAPPSSSHGSSLGTNPASSTLGNQTTSPSLSRSSTILLTASTSTSTTPTDSDSTPTKSPTSSFSSNSEISASKTPETKPSASKTTAGEGNSSPSKTSTTSGLANTNTSSSSSTQKNDGGNRRARNGGAMLAFIIGVVGVLL